MPTAIIIYIEQGPMEKFKNILITVFGITILLVLLIKIEQTFSYSNFNFLEGMGVNLDIHRYNSEILVNIVLMLIWLDYLLFTPADKAIRLLVGAALFAFLTVQVNFLFGVWFLLGNYKNYKQKYDQGVIEDCNCLFMKYYESQDKRDFFVFLVDRQTGVAIWSIVGFLVFFGLYCLMIFLVFKGILLFLDLF